MKETKELEEWQCHIAHTQKGRETESLCGRTNILNEFHFTGLEHWFNNRLCEGRLAGCPECLRALRKTLDEEYEICEIS